MKPAVSWGVAVMAVLAAVALVVVCWTRPDLLDTLGRRVMPESLLGTSVPDEALAPAESELPAELIEDGWCRAHERPLAWCEEEGSSVGDKRPCDPGSLPLVRLSSGEVAKRIGLSTGNVVSRQHADTLLGNAEITYDEHAYAEVRPRVRGLVDQVTMDHGRIVRRGDLLAVIDSSEVGTVKSEYLAALPIVELAEATLERTSSLTRSNALPLKDELEARTAVNRARADLSNAAQRLRNLGFLDSDLVRIAEEQDTSSLLRILSPIDGTVIERHAVPGEAIEPTDQLAAIANLDHMWALIDVYEDEIDRVRPGQEVTFQITGVQDHIFAGEVEWIDTAVNPTTRTIRVRAELANPDGRLRAHEFGLAEIRVGEPHEATFVPSSAIQFVQGERLVFLADPDGTFRPQRVVLEDEQTLNNEKEVLWGLSAGDAVVTTGSFLLRSELLRDELAGE